MNYLDYAGLQRVVTNCNTVYGSSITLEIDSDYKLTAKLKNKNNVVISTSNVIDLPIESAIVNATYDNTTKDLTFTLQNGSTIVVPLDAIVGGLQSEITSQNKLSADLVDDTSTTNKFVTSSDKSKWNSCVRFDTNAQGLTTIQQENARTNIGAGTSNFSGSYSDLSNKPTIPTKTSDLTNDGSSGTSTYLQASDMTPISNANIDSLFV